jgi:hypothetical protein
LKKRSYTQLPTFVWNPVGEASAQGHDAVRASVARWKGAWDEYEVTHEEFVDAGDRVVVTLHLRGRGRGSGVEIDARFFDVYTIRVVLAVVAPHGVRIVGAQPWPVLLRPQDRRLPLPRQIIEAGRLEHSPT